MNAASVSMILKEGTPVSTRLDHGLTWHRNLVYKSEGRHVYLSLLESYIDNIIAPGSIILLRYYNEYFIYTFEGVVSSIHPDFPPYVTVRINNADEVINSRLSPRYDVHMAAGIISLWEDTISFAVVTDISYGGIAFISTEKYEINEELTVSINLPALRLASIKCKVLRKTVKGSANNYSVQFMDITEEKCNLLSKYFLTIEEEVSAIRKNYITNIKGKLQYSVNLKNLNYWECEK